MSILCSALLLKKRMRWLPFAEEWHAYGKISPELTCLTVLPFVILFLGKLIFIEMRNVFPWLWICQMGHYVHLTVPKEKKWPIWYWNIAYTSLSGDFSSSTFSSIFESMKSPMLWLGTGTDFTKGLLGCRNISDSGEEQTKPHAMITGQKPPSLRSHP